MRIDYIRANVVSLAIYLIAFFAKSAPGAEIMLGIAGMLSLFIATPMAFFQVFKISSFSIVEKYFAFLTFYFFLYSPLFFFLNQSAGISVSTENILIANLAIFACALVVTKLGRGDGITINFDQVLNKRNSILFAALAGFLFLHAINYHFYGFMPEWDGYTDLIKLEKGLEDQNVAQEYRGFFYSSIGILATFSGIRLYTLFTFFFIALQTSLLFVLSRLVRLSNFKEKSIEAVIYLLALSVPVINMEIDMTRPQNAVIIFLPILIYFTFRFFTEKKIAFFLLASVIAMGGMNYHEFFVFPLLTYAVWVGLVFMRRALSSDVPRDQRIIAALVITCFGLIGAFASREVNALQGVVATAWNILLHVSDISAWRLWFIGNYSSDGAVLQMGWPGVTGAMKYYAYYFSPALVLIVIALVFGLVKKIPFMKDPLIRIISPLLLVLFVFAEILPRLNHLYLPERFWLLMDMLLILSSVPLLKYLTGKSPKESRMILLSLAALCIVGIAGSFYIAANKKALTSESEYRAAMWIREHTTENSSFITQAANGPMIAFFAERTDIPIGPEYFLAKEVLEQDPKAEIEKLSRSVVERNAEIDSLVNQYTENRISFFEFADKIQEQKAILKKTEREIKTLEKLVDQPKYVVYSFDKFDTIYREREWWMRENAYGANIEKFNDTYPLVYEQDGVYIWKVR